MNVVRVLMTDGELAALDKLVDAMQRGYDDTATARTANRSKLIRALIREAAHEREEAERATE